MCFSAKVTQSLREYLRLTGASPDLLQMEEIFQRRLTESIRIARGFERNFDNPQTPEEQRIRELLDQHRGAAVTKFEQDLFA